MKFKVTQIFRDGHDNLDDDVKIIDANNKEEAEKIYWEKNFRIKGFYKLTVEPIKDKNMEKGINEFQRMQELAGIDNEETKSDNFSDTGYFEKGGPEAKYNVADCLKEIRYEAENALEIGQGKQNGDNTDIISKITRAQYFCQQALDLMDV